MKKKLTIIFILLILVITSGAFCHYYISTISAFDCFDYCIEHSQNDAEKFKTKQCKIGTGLNQKTYLLFVAINEDETKTQEMFAFRKKHFIFSDYSRYELVESTIESEGTIASAVSIPTGIGKNAKRALVVFGSDIKNSGSYILKENDSNSISIYITDGIWTGVFENFNEETADDIKLYDGSGKLIYSYK